MEETTPPSLSIIPAHVAKHVIESDRSKIVELVANAYRMFGLGDALNPDSYFLALPDAHSRIIALPAYLNSNDMRVAGIKWIASFPSNLEYGLHRASALLILNSMATGYPFACIEGSVISAARTAASAAIGAKIICGNHTEIAQLGIVGCGVIAHSVLDFLIDSGWKINKVVLFDLSSERAACFKHSVAKTYSIDIEVAPELKASIQSSDLILFATTARAPYVTESSWFEHNPRILHISLRDLSPDIILGAANIVDDADHCLKANTSLHLAEQKVGHRQFIDASICDLLLSPMPIAIPTNKPIIYSPFGMGVLDLMVGYYIFMQANSANQVTAFHDFFPA